MIDNNENIYIIHTSHSSTLIKSNDWQKIQKNPDKSIKSPREGRNSIMDSNSNQSGNRILNVAFSCKINYSHYYVHQPSMIKTQVIIIESRLSDFDKNKKQRLNNKSIKYWTSNRIKYRN